MPKYHIDSESNVEFPTSMNSLLPVFIERFFKTENSPILFIYGTQVFKLERTNESKFVLLFLLDGSSVSLLSCFRVPILMVLVFLILAKEDL